MKDRIIEGYLTDFSSQYGLEQLDPSQLFAYFVNYCVLSRLTPETLSLDDFHVDGGKDTGIDAVAIIVNGHIVISKEDVDFFRDNLRRLDVEFVFVQSKTAAKFNAAEIGSFLFGVKQFFDPNPTLPASDEVMACRELKEYIYDFSINMEQNPICSLYYATTGKWCDDENLMARIEADKSDLRATDLFSEVVFRPFAAENLKNVYRELRNKVVKEIYFDKHTILPAIDKVQEAYLGFLPCVEFLKFICDTEGNIQRNLFYDNVRDYQGDNPVNREIAQTLRTPGISDKFVLLNNGITVVARSINKVGAMFKISDYQVVNGCQTSNVLYLNRRHLTDQVFIPLKLIVTDDPEVTNLIIKATNRQTEIKLEAFESLEPFHRKLEEFYASFEKDSPKRLYYERRSRQYANLPVKPKQIITLAAQSKAFLAMFLNEPHSTPRYYGEILNANRGRMFIEKHSPFPYYTAALALVLIDSFFREGELPGYLKKFKYHMMMLLRINSGGSGTRPLQGEKADQYSEKICQVLWDHNSAITEFTDCANIIKRGLKSFTGDTRLAYRLRSFTAHLIPNLKKRPNGKIKYFNLERGFGFIEMVGGPDIFVHYTAIKGTKDRYFSPGEHVEFDILQTEKGPQAQDVKLIGAVDA
jgi:cold shock CspA family protein